MTIPFRLALPALGFFLLSYAKTPHVGAQAAPQIERAADESGLTITCEVFCSDTKLRTSNARIRWYSTKPGPQATSLASAKPTLQTTVYAQGFEKNLYVNVPVGPDAPQRAPVAAAPTGAGRQRPLRAFQFVVLRLEPPRSSAADTPESGIVVEDLEPGMSYRWRIVAEGAGTAITSPVVMCKALVCPADMVREPGLPREGKRP